jgi:Calcium binding
MGWYYYLEGKLRFPFAARCIKRRATSPFKIGESLSITGLAPEDDCMREIIVITEYHGRALGVPLAQLRPRKVDAATKQAIEDWHYWVAMGYQY